MLAFPLSLWLLLGTATATACAGVLAGVLFSGSSRRARVAIPLSSGLLLGVALFGLLPELAQNLSWVFSLSCFAAGYGLLALLDRVGLSICPECAHDHDHEGCVAPLHGFAAPILVAAGLHSLFDGWALAVSHVADGQANLKIALPLALILHKIPEGLALGGILKPALRLRWQAIALGLGVEGLTLVGGVVAMLLQPRHASGWTNYPLALAGGFFLFLAAHALHGEWKKSRFALVPGTAGLLFAALLQTGLRSYFGL